MAAATLSAQTDDASGATTASLSVTSDQATGTVYVVITTSATTPSHAQIVAKQTHTGAAATWGCNKAAALTNTFDAGGLTASTAYYAHFTQVNAGAEASTPVSGGGFTTRATRVGNIVKSIVSDI